MKLKILISSLLIVMLLSASGCMFDKNGDQTTPLNVHLDNGLVTMPLLWQGSLSAAPGSPATGWAYHNTTDTAFPIIMMVQPGNYFVRTVQLGHRCELALKEFRVFKELPVRLVRMVRKVRLDLPEPQARRVAMERTERTVQTAPMVCQFSGRVL